MNNSDNGPFDFLLSEELQDVMNYAAYLEANGLELDENGREVKKDRNKSLTLYPNYLDDDDE